KKEYREAYLIWKEENPKKEDVPQSAMIELPNGKKVPLGRRISTMKLIYKSMQEGKHYGACKDLTEDEILWWTEQGLVWSIKQRMSYTEEEYHKAYLIWKKENPKKESVPILTVIDLPNGKSVPLGQRIYTMQMIYGAMQEGKHYKNSRDLTEDEITWWTEHGLVLGTKQKMSYTEEEYREAYLLWKKENPKKRNVPRSTVVILPNGNEVPLGRRIPTMKLIYKAMQEGKHYQSNRDLTEEQISWWTKQGIDLMENLIASEDEYREAYLIWKKKHPEEENILFDTVIELPNGKSIPLGRRISIMRHIYQAMQEGKHYRKFRDLTEDEILWWTEHGVNLEKGLRQICSEEEYREAYLIWKEGNPKKEDVPCSAVIDLPNGKKVPLGRRIPIMKLIYKAMQEGKHYGSHSDLTEDEILWWTDHGVDLGKKIICSEEDYQEAYLIWRKQNPEKEDVPQVTVIDLPNGKRVPLGTKVSIMKLIYCAMLEGKHYKNYRDLTEEQIAWWTEHGLSFEKRRNTWTVKNVLQEFNIDCDELIKSLENVKVKKEKVEFSESTGGKTLKSLCKEGGYNFDITLKAVKLHKFFQNDTLEQLINRMIISNLDKKGIASWIYDVYGDFIIQILRELNLNASKILKDMSR
ncbi:MAG: hypothetical protein K2I72_03135, partial [Bacilli bacterium]|nr:hypothetical protein [Bacilli bacterium]